MTQTRGEWGQNRSGSICCAFAASRHSIASMSALFLCSGERHGKVLYLGWSAEDAALSAASGLERSLSV